MSDFYTKGETKERPGVHKRYENSGGPEIAGATEGICCVIVSGNWGKPNTPVEIDAGTDIADVIGNGTGAEVIQAVREGGTNTIIVVRAGTGGTAGTVTLKGEVLGKSEDAAKLTALYPGNRAFSVTVRKSLDNDIMKELLICEGTKVLETVKFVKSANDVVGLEYALRNSKYVKVEVINKLCSMTEVQQQAFEVGTNPQVDVEAYSAALEACESETWNVLCLDTNDTKVHTLLASFIDRIYEDGAYPLACISEPEFVDLDTRMQHAAAFNDEKIHYVLNSWLGTDGKVYEGFIAAAKIAGMIAAVAANESLTHTVIPGAVSLNERLTNSSIRKALGQGCLILSLNKSRQVWIEKAINTLVTPASNQDAGWKKIRRVKTRFELFDRIDRTLEPLNGQVDNTVDGRAAVIAAGQNVIDAMVGENKLLAGGEMYLDTTNPPQGDSAWFIIAVDDVDSLEHIYLSYHFRFAASTEEE